VEKKVVNITESRVRFSEIDSMLVVWHGNYAKFLEDGREAFGEQYGFGYYDAFDNGYLTPIVDVKMNYKFGIKYGDTVRIETIYRPTKAAKILFDYNVFRVEGNVLALTGSSMQVFVDKEGVLQLTNPKFYVEWMKKVGVL